MRYRTMSIFDESNNNIIYDPTSIDWKQFGWTQGYYKHYVSNQEIVRPYLIAYEYFSDVNYEDVILLLNGIEHVWDLFPGCILKIPKRDELDIFILSNIK